MKLISQKPSVLTLSTLLWFSIAGIAGHVQAAELEPVRGVVKSYDQAVISVDLNARVLETPLRTGENFSEGDLLIRFDCERHHAEAKAAAAAYGAAESAYQTNVEMHKHGAAGEFDVNHSKSEMQSALAQSEATAARTKDCQVLAPFDGRVAELAINAFETAAPNQPLLKIVGNGNFELHLIVPSNWLAWLSVDSEFDFAIDETGKQHRALVSQIGAEVDAVSRTVAVIARFEESPESVLPGMSGTAYFSKIEKPVVQSLADSSSHD